MKKIEYILWTLLIATIWLKFINIEVGKSLSVLMILLSGTIGTLYPVFSSAYLNGLKFQNTAPNLDFSNISKFRNGISYYLGGVYAVLIYSVLFKLHYWPGRDFLGQAGLLTGSIGIVLLLYFEKDKNSRFYKMIINRTILISLFAAIFYFATVDNLVDIQWRNYPKYAEAKKRHLKDIDNPKLKEEAERIYGEEHLR